MNVTEYIASGILESYVMGAVSDQEKREVECLSAIYPEVRNELDDLSKALENYALLHSLEPPVALKTRLMEHLEFNEPDHKTIVRPMPVDRESGPTYRTTWIVAASVGLLVLIFSFFLLSQLRTNQNTMASLRTVNNSLQAEVRQLRDHQSQADQTLALLRQPGTRTLELRGNEKAPQGDILVYWNARTRQVALEVQSLPALPPDQQYQLWSLVDGKPIDAGVFEVNTQNQLVQRLNRPIARADAFAVTVEKRGGSPTPTLSTLLAMTPTGV
ncbi:anti-sigma factor [Spirosoma utsteinense]|uniref:Anti-sigma-K factor RskA n=1 Tax=Spirosoma utsteinense TaxID=2585773 RepID=A0ABR6WEC6_9BACT|nr:anti-sigma factor [Spirosoma utsteinense]MBC3788386.1 anti-sigma-K factor RskA [Spirosoma utsteinense]MBC3794350.1 anti-sigma-K factor RskA [Spirosoma utsteinense]